MLEDVLAQAREVIIKECAAAQRPFGSANGVDGAEGEDSDALRETFILRKTSLSQDQWDKYLSAESSKKEEDPSEVSSALLGRKSGFSQGSATGDGAVTSRKSSTFDVETGISTAKASERCPFDASIASSRNKLECKDQASSYRVKACQLINFGKS